MRRGLSALSIALPIAVLAVGCCCNPMPPPPVGPCGAIACPADAGPPFLIDARVPPTTFDLCAEPGFASACAVDCRGSLACFRERRTTATAADAGVVADGGAPSDAGELDAGTLAADGGPDGGPPVLEATAFPGGLCSIGCASDADCGTTGCAVCVPYALAGRARLRGLVGGSGVCRPACNPDSFGSCGPGYACDRTTGACLEACVDDEQCRFRTVDVDGDGTDDVLQYDPDPDVRCDLAFGRCEAPREPIGGPCADASQCEPGYACVRHPDAELGQCALDCTFDETLCGDTATCMLVPGSGGQRVCAQRCAIGAEPPEDVAGSTGHGAGCPLRFLCRWDGDPSGAEGGCMPGEYNDVVDPNTGAPCTVDDDCFSPYGRGLCLRPHDHAPQGICIVVDCEDDGSGQPGLVPGVPVSDVSRFCDPARGLSCVPLITDTSDSACVAACATAEACPAGWACTRLLATDQRACAPNCEADADCGAGGRCQYVDTTPCAGRPSACFCR